VVNAIVKAMYDKLKGNATLMTKLGGTAANYYKIYHVIAPQNVALPYITYGLLTDIPIATFGALDDMEDITVYLNIFSDSGSAKVAGEILDLVKAVLDDADLTITGYGNDMYCMREFVGTTVFDMEARVWQIPMRYRILAEKD